MCGGSLAGCSSWVIQRHMFLCFVLPAEQQVTQGRCQAVHCSPGPWSWWGGCCWRPSSHTTGTGASLSPGKMQSSGSEWSFLWRPHFHGTNLYSPAMEIGLKCKSEKQYRASSRWNGKATTFACEGSNHGAGASAPWSTWLQWAPCA